MIRSIHQSIWGMTLFSCRCSLTPNTVSVSDRPAHLVSGSSPKDGFISVKCYDCLRTDISLDTVFVGMNGGLTLVYNSLV